MPVLRPSAREVQHTFFSSKWKRDRYSRRLPLYKFRIIGGTNLGWGLEPLTKRSRDNLPNPKYDRRNNAYVPVNSPAIGDLFDLFNFAQ